MNPTPKDIDELQEIRFLLQKPSDPALNWFQTQFNSHHSDVLSILEVNSLFDVTQTPTALKDNAIEILRKCVVDHLVESAMNPDEADIQGKIQNCVFMHHNRHNQMANFRSSTAFEANIRQALNEPHSHHSAYKNQMCVHVSSTCPCPKSREHADVRDFANISIYPPPVVNETTTSATTSTLNATLGGLQQTMQDMSRALQNNASSSTQGASTTHTDLEMINVNGPPPEVKLRMERQLDPSIVRARKEFKKFKNPLTTDSSGTVHALNFVVCPPGRENFCISKSGARFTAKDQTSSLRKQFKSGIPELKDTTAAGWFSWCSTFEKHADSCRVWVMPVEDQKVLNDERGFIVADQCKNNDADFPPSHSSVLDTWSEQMCQALTQDDAFPERSVHHDKIRLHPNRGYEGLRSIHMIFHPDLLRTPPSCNATIPRQQQHQDFKDFVDQCRFCQQMRGHMDNMAIDFGDEQEQNRFIANLFCSTEITGLLRPDRESTSPRTKARFSRGQFLQTVAQADKEVRTIIAPTPRQHHQPSSSQRPPRRITTAAQRIKKLHSLQAASQPGMQDMECDVNVQSLCGVMNHIEVPEDGEHREDAGLLRPHTALMALDRDLNRFDSKTQACAVCGQMGHSFDGCPASQDFPTARQHCIKTCTAVNRLKKLADQSNRPLQDARHAPLHTLELEVQSIGTKIREGAPSMAQSTPTQPHPLHAVVPHPISSMQQAPVHPMCSNCGFVTPTPPQVPALQPQFPAHHLPIAPTPNPEIAPDDSQGFCCTPQSFNTDLHSKTREGGETKEEDKTKEEDSRTKKPPQNTEAMEDIALQKLSLSSINADALTHRTMPSEDMPSIEHEDDGDARTISISNVGNAQLTQHNHGKDDSLDYDGPRAQVDTGAKATATNLLCMSHEVRFFNDRFPCPARMFGATKKDHSMTPEAVGCTRVPAMNRQGCLEVECFHSPEFASTPLSKTDAVRSTKRSHEHHGQTTDKFFDQDHNKMSKALSDGHHNTSAEPEAHTLNSGHCSIIAHHEKTRKKNVIISGIIRNGQMLTGRLTPPNLPTSHPEANSHNSLEFTKLADKGFRDKCKAATLQAMHECQEEEFRKLRDEPQKLPERHQKTPLHHFICSNTPMHAIRSRTEQALWHQRLGHASQGMLKSAHEHAKGIPEFKGDNRFDEVENCSTCIRSKLHEASPGKKGIQEATRPCQCLSMDFSFSGVISKDQSRRTDTEGMNGETSWILVQDHFSKITHGDTRLSKASPTEWIEQFLQQHSPKCDGKAVVLDQGGELHGNPVVRNIFKKCGHTIHPAGADASCQNSSERYHRTMADGVRAMLLGANLDIEFWPCAFHHFMRIANATPGKGQSKSPLEITAGQQDDFAGFKTFGCRVWVRPPSRRRAKFRSDARKGTFLGFLPHTNRNILWCDASTDKVKIATHCRFDEGFNDLPVEALPPSVQQLRRLEDGNRTTFEDEKDTHTGDLEFHTHPFASALQGAPMPPTRKSPHEPSTPEHCGFSVADDDLLQRAHVAKINPKTPAAAAAHHNPKLNGRKTRGAHVTSINGEPVFNSDDVSRILEEIRVQGVPEFEVTFAPEPKTDAKKLRKATDECNLLAPATTKPAKRMKDDLGRTLNKEGELIPDDDGAKRHPLGTKAFEIFGQGKDKAEHQGKAVHCDHDDKLCKALCEDGDKEEPWHNEIKKHLNPRTKKKRRRNKPPQLACAKPAPTEFDEDVHQPESTVDMTRSMASPKTGLSMSEVEVPDELIRLCIMTLQSDSMTPEEQALGHFTGRKLKKLETWPLWEKGEHKQLNQFHEQKMFGDPIDPNAPSEDSIVLRPHWQHAVKRDGTGRSRQCCDGSERAAPQLHAVASTWSSCVEPPVQRLFPGLCASLNPEMHGADVKDAHAHSDEPEVPTCPSIDNAHSEWHEKKFEKRIDGNPVLPAMHSLQGHPESGEMWMKLIDRIPPKEMGFKTTTHDRCICRRDDGPDAVLMIRQADDFMIGCKSSKIAEDVTNIIGEKVKFPTEDKLPITFLGLVQDCNGVDIIQTPKCIGMSCGNHMDRLLKSHGWNKEKKDAPKTKPSSPIPEDSMSKMFSEEGPKEGTVEHTVLEKQQGFRCRTSLGELMCAHVTARLDVGHAVTTPSKFSSNPSEHHCHPLKGVAKHPRATHDWGIRHKRNGASENPNFKDDVSFDANDFRNDECEFPVTMTRHKLICFVDAAHANDLRNRRSTTGMVFVFAGGAVPHKSKTQTITAGSSTEAEFMAAHTAGKTVRCLRSTSKELGFGDKDPTPICIDNESALEIIDDNQAPTERTGHMDMRFFSLQDWKEDKDLIMVRIPGTLDPSDDLTEPLGWVLHSRHCRRMMGHHWSADQFPCVLEHPSCDNSMSAMGAHGLMVAILGALTHDELTSKKAQILESVLLTTTLANLAESAGNHIQTGAFPLTARFADSDTQCFQDNQWKTLLNCLTLHDDLD